MAEHIRGGKTTFSRDSDQSRRSEARKRRAGRRELIRKLRDAKRS